MDFRASWLTVRRRFEWRENSLCSMLGMCILSSRLLIHSDLIKCDFININCLIWSKDAPILPSEPSSQIVSSLAIATINHTTHGSYETQSVNQLAWSACRCHGEILLQMEAFLSRIRKSELLDSKYQSKIDQDLQWSREAVLRPFQAPDNPVSRRLSLFDWKAHEYSIRNQLFWAFHCNPTNFLALYLDELHACCVNIWVPLPSISHNLRLISQKIVHAFSNFCTTHLLGRILKSSKCAHRPRRIHTFLKCWDVWDAIE